MGFQLNKNSFIVFDLDDTLYAEVDFLKSAFKEIASLLTKLDTEKLVNDMYNNYLLGSDVFSILLSSFPQSGFKKIDLINIYRSHLPKIKLSRNADMFIKFLLKNNIPIGIITDGRSITQRNKIHALGIESILEELVISEEFGSEKPDENNYTHFEKKFPNMHFTYIADNTQKDFISPNRLGWQMVCVLNNGRNIHAQQLAILPEHAIVINDFKELVIAMETTG